MSLSDAQIRAAKATDKPVKLFDGGGMFLLVTPQGNRWWRLKYRYGGKERQISLGVYPAVGLKEARARRDEARKRLFEDKVDPSTHRQAEKAGQADTLKAVAEEWLERQAHKLASITLSKQKWMLTEFIYPRLGTRSLPSITPAELLVVLRVIESKGHHETAIRTKQVVSRVYRYAIATSRAERDIAADLRGALAQPVTKNRAAITDPAQIGPLLRAIDGYTGQPATHAALRLAPLVFVRPGELRAAAWPEFDLEAEEPVWRIPAERMKMREQHLVPLSTQAVAILKELHKLTGHRQHAFPAIGRANRPLSENTLRAALIALGYDGDTMTVHGFRSMASTLLNEQGWNADWIEAQLAHFERNKVRGAYNHAKYLAGRRQMMQAWADYLGGLKVGSNVMPIRTSSAA